MIRTFLVLGRLSNLPTVWSNCLCAHVLAGGSFADSFYFLLVGTSLLYVGGMYLNDVCDVEYDRKHRPERPIPSGAISRALVVRLSIMFVVTGTVLCGVGGPAAFAFAMILLALIVAYNIVHKRFAYSVLLMAGCRACLYFICGISQSGKLANGVILIAAIMFLYITGLSLIARRENSGGSVTYAAVTMILAPLVGLVISAINSGHVSSVIVAAAVVLWIGMPLMVTRKSGSNCGRATIGQLLAGMVLVDLAFLACANVLTLPIGVVHVTLYIAAIVAQRKIPAT